MNRIVRVFQNSWPGLRSKPIQRYRPAAKKRGGSAAIVIVLSAANHSPYTYHPAYFPNTAEGIREQAQQNAENYYLSARWDHIDLFQWPISNLQQGETRWSSKESLDWHKLREDLANDFGYKDKYDEGETKHPIPIYVLWNRGYTVRYVQGEYDEDAIKAEWEEKVDLFIESWEIYNDEFEAVRQWRDWVNGGWFTQYLALTLRQFTIQKMKKATHIQALVVGLGCRLRSPLLLLTGEVTAVYGLMVLGIIIV